MVDNSSKGAVYKGLALGGTAAAPQLYVANFNAGTVEVYDGNFAPVKLATGAFTDSQIPAGFAPSLIANPAETLRRLRQRRRRRSTTIQPDPTAG